MEKEEFEFLTGGYSRWATKHRLKKEPIALSSELSPRIKGCPSTATSKETRL
jgi:hypothetical protein